MTPTSTSPTRAEGARVGPNAATRVAQALMELGEGASAPMIFALAGVSDWLERPPTEMVDERRVASLHRAVRDVYPARRAGEILSRAGALTADYLLAHRIPLLFKWLLPWLPRRWGAALFLSAIRRHAWTFVGSGRFHAEVRARAIIEVRGNPLCAGEHRGEAICDWHAAVFERLFADLIRPSAHVEQIACEARGDDGCRFRLSWTAPAPRA